MRKLEQLGTLSVLSLTGTNISDTGLRNLEQLGALRELSLVGTDISDAGLAHLRGLPLRRLWLEDTRVSDAGLVHIKEMAQLELLGLGGTKVTRPALDQLFREVPRLRGHVIGVK